MANWLAFEDAGAAYVDVEREPNGSSAMMKILNSKTEPHIPYAPPFLKDGDLIVPHVANILLYLGLIRHYSVSNFTAPLLDEAVKAPGGKEIVTNQFVSPFLANRSLVDATQRLGIKVTAYIPLGEGHAHNDQTPQGDRAEALRDAPAQVTFAWLLSRDILVLSASTNPEHQKSNWETQKLKLDAEDIAKIDVLDEGRRNANPSFAPK